MLSSPLHRLLVPTTLLVLGISGSAAAQQTLGELYASDASVKGSVMLAGSGTSVFSGSSIQAGAQAATLKLERGGSLLVCEGTKLSSDRVADRPRAAVQPEQRQRGAELSPGRGGGHAADARSAAAAARSGNRACRGAGYAAGRYLRAVVALEPVGHRGFRDHGRRHLSGEVRRSGAVSWRTSGRFEPVKTELRMSDIAADPGGQGGSTTSAAGPSPSPLSRWPARRCRRRRSST